MTLTIDGKKIVAQPGQSLLDLVKELGMEGKTVSSFGCQNCRRGI